MIEFFESNGLNWRPIIGGPKCPTKKLSQLIDTLLKPFWKHIKILIFNSLNFLIENPKDVNEDIKKVYVDVISFYANNFYEFGLEPLDYFLTTYKEDLNPRFKKELVLESTRFTIEKQSGNNFY